ncbi:DMT family transporter [Sphingosinicella ginsenosidimutans]|jgi:drug/metabolite transporter (DMT)-like permease|uniref:DMT family transporter n=1 Tax=Allosphingosinicella ginsenosidimutans TaxID=1176539 RepID=A0A5C6TU64_9SPHN|nr:DMT family transporter [Sphingosinicella ginsenosidimutans]TXC63650.1 DMT family transporter [Sphingosinicella ginsenosidimutans]
MSDAGAGLRDPKLLLPFILVTLIWSSTWIVIKGQLGVVPAVWSVSYRFLIAGAVMAIVARAAGISLRLDAGGHRLAMLLGLLQFVINYNFVYAAERHINSGLTAVVFALLVVPNAVMARLFFKVPVSGRFVAGSAVAMAGVALLFIDQLRSAPAGGREALIGLGLTLVAVLGASGANVMQIAPAMRGRAIAGILAWAMLYGGFGDGLFALLTSGAPVFDPRPSYWIGLFYLGVIASSLAFWLYYRIIRVIGAAEAAYSSVLIPIVAMAISTAWEDYRWTPLAIAGGFTAIAGLVTALGARRPVSVDAAGDAGSQQPLRR